MIDPIGTHTIAVRTTGNVTPNVNIAVGASRVNNDGCGASTSGRKTATITDVDKGVGATQADIQWIDTSHTGGCGLEGLALDSEESRVKVSTGIQDASSQKSVTVEVLTKGSLVTASIDEHWLAITPIARQPATTGSGRTTGGGGITNVIITHATDAVNIQRALGNNADPSTTYLSRSGAIGIASTGDIHTHSIGACLGGRTLGGTGTTNNTDTTDTHLTSGTVTIGGTGSDAGAIHTTLPRGTTMSSITAGNTLSTATTDGS